LILALYGFYVESAIICDGDNAANDTQQKKGYDKKSSNHPNARGVAC